jgi:DNA-nicking Smr family endonuclease
MDEHDDENDDDALWAYVTRNIKPLKGRDTNKVRKPEKPDQNKSENHPVSLPGKASEQQVKSEGAGSRSVDRSTALKFQRGQMQIESRIDLHGYTRHEAKDLLSRHLTNCYKRGIRVVLVITGKGSRLAGDASDGLHKGVLKKAVPDWLDEKPLSDIVLKYQTAKQRDGGEGALYILLRRKR